MKKSLLVLIGIIGLALVAGIAAFMYVGRDEPNTSTSITPANQTENLDNHPANQPEVSAEVSNDNHLKGANIGQTVDATTKSAVTVEIDDYLFETTVLKVKKGTTVTWVNDGKVQHDVTSATNSPKQGLSSGMLGTDETYEHTFNEVGTYQYFCSLHPTQMRGIVEVVE